MGRGGGGKNNKRKARENELDDSNSDGFNDAGAKLLKKPKYKQAGPGSHQGSAAQAGGSSAGSSRDARAAANTARGNIVNEGRQPRRTAQQMEQDAIPHGKTLAQLLWHSEHCGKERKPVPLCNKNTEHATKALNDNKYVFSNAIRDFFLLAEHPAGLNGIFLIIYHCVVFSDTYNSIYSIATT